MQPTTSTTNISITPTRATQTEAGPSVVVANVQSSSEKMESIELLSTYTTLYSMHNTQADELTPCSFTHTDHKAQFAHSKCTLTLKEHQHTTTKIEKVNCVKNPIPHKAFAKSETLRYIDSVDQNWAALEHISTVLYPSSAQLPNFRSTPSNQLPVTETIKNKETFCIHKIKTQLLVPIAENPIPDGAFAVNQLVTYTSADISEESLATALSTGSVTLTPSGSGAQFFFVVPNIAVPTIALPNAFIPSTSACQQALTDIKSRKRIRLPLHWKEVNEEIQAFYLDDIEQCLDLNATYSMIIDRHQLPRGNIHALVQLRRKLRSAKAEFKLGQAYKKGSPNVLTLPELPKGRIPLGQYLAMEPSLHQSRYLAKKLKGEVKHSRTALKQVKSRKATPHFAKPLALQRPRFILPAIQPTGTSSINKNSPTGIALFHQPIFTTTKN